MSDFERSAWDWYCDTATDFALEAGIVAQEFKDLRLKGRLRAMFLRAASVIHRTFELIRADQARRAREEAQRGR